MVALCPAVFGQRRRATGEWRLAACQKTEIRVVEGFRLEVSVRRSRSERRGPSPSPVILVSFRRRWDAD
jgi:hypothetical protein